MIFIEYIYIFILTIIALLIADLIKSSIIILLNKEFHYNIDI